MKKIVLLTALALLMSMCLAGVFLLNAEPAS